MARRKDPDRTATPVIRRTRKLVTVAGRPWSWPDGGGAGVRHRPIGAGQSSSLRAETKASWGTSTRPMFFIFFFPSFCFSSSLRLRVMSPP